MSAPRRDEVLAILRRHKAEFAARFGVTELGVFGSVARDEAAADSDVDIVVWMRNPGCSSWCTLRTLWKSIFKGRWTSFTTVRG